MLPSGIEVDEAWGWKPGDDEFIPTSLFFDSPSDVKRLTVLPYLAVEVLSTDFAADTIRKFAKYAAAGLERYWIVDPEEPVIVVYHLDDGIYGEIPRHQPGETAELNVGPARVTLDPAQLLA